LWLTSAESDPAIGFARANRPQFLEELRTFVRIPSISMQPERAGDVARCAAWLANHLRGIGLDEVSIVPTTRHPIVTAAWTRARGRPTLLVYGHYDVQPVDPVRDWTHPPFAAVVAGDRLFGRGACDDKGQLFTHVKAIEAQLKTERSLPVNVKCLFEGGEEIDSPHLHAFVRRRQDQLAADVAVMSDTAMLGPDRPAISYSERGQLRLELDVRGPSHDLHSGNFGGAVHNPLQALCEIVGRLHDRDGRVAIPGFYDRVRPLAFDERRHLARVGPPRSRILENAGVDRPWGERGFTVYERTTARPALVVNGIDGGYHGPGVKGVLPARASAKISFRLVPDQDPAYIDALFRQQVARLTPPTVRASVRTLSGSPPALVSPSHPAMRAASLAYRRAFGRAPVFVRSGGSIPIVNTFQQVLGIPTVLMGFALPDSNIHAPNEQLHLPTFYRGVETSLWFMRALARMGRWSSTATATREPAIS
jgi:acetylornithine deacetylase/succinyl-diaminopimelate desuccinylase-like protein